MSHHGFRTIRQLIDAARAAPRASGVRRRASDVQLAKATHRGGGNRKGKLQVPEGTLSTAQAALRLGVCKRRIDQLRREGKLARPAGRLKDGTAYYLLADVLACLERLQKAREGD